MKTQILDCTLRDGGYYGDWDFDEDTVSKYLAAVATAKIDIIEIGFRFLPQERFLGPFAYSTDDYLGSLPLPSNALISVMINANDIIKFVGGIKKAVNILFTEKKKSPVDIVRIATNHIDIAECFQIAEILQMLGYRVFLNLMQVDKLSANEIQKISRTVKKWNSVEVIYLADSFGNMEPESIKKMVSIFRIEWGGSIGIHTHDNKGLALINSIAALNCGVNFIDATLLGMGRGAGNAKIENLLVEMSQRGQEGYFPDALFPIVLQEFNELQNKYGWGSNIYYFLSAVHGIHPSYIQKMLGDGRYGTEHILSAINFLKSTNTPFYSLENMLRAISGIEGDEIGTWSASGWAKDSEVIIIGAGSGTKRYVNALTKYIKRRKPIVLCLNVNESIPNELVTAYVACHETRILIEVGHYSKLTKPIILPLSRVPEPIRYALKDANILDYGLRVNEGSFQISDNGCVLNSTLALAYALSISTVAGAERILLAGMDGYDATDSRQKEMLEMIEAYSKLESALPIIAITPTSYPVEQRSVFEADLSIQKLQ